MAEDKKDIKDLEQQLFKEFNEHINLSEPSDSRLQDSVDLNPDKLDNSSDEVVNNEEEATSTNKKQQVAADEEDSSKAKAAIDENEPAIAKQKDATENLDLGAAFSNFVESEQVDSAIKEENDKKEEAFKKLKKPKKLKLDGTKLQNILARCKAYAPILIENLKLLATKLKLGIAKSIHLLKSPFIWLANLTKKQKLVLTGIVFMILTSGISSYLVYKEFFTGKAPYLTSFSELTGEVFTYKAAQKYQPFFSKAFMPSYIYVLPKVITNLKRSRNSGANPMIFIELVLSASNQATAVELKDREIAMKDKVARTIEAYSFDEMQSAEGKVLLKKDIKNNVGLLLNNGNVSDVLFKSFIVKP